MLNHIEEYSELFINDVPLMDVRAPVEYKQGSFPNTVNLPILDDQQREVVGTCYKKMGKEFAINKGHELISGDIREARIATWVDFAKQNPNGHLYCFRGGMRSQIAQQWMQESGRDLPIVKGGYKALRNYLLNVLEESASVFKFKLIGGKTGSGKTLLINKFHNSVDLEAAAYHRGSSFGRHAKPQNTQINFENILAIQFLKLSSKNKRNLILEDEARTIGKVGLPKLLFEKMRQSPIVVIEDTLETRLERLLQEYVIEMLAEFTEIEGDQSGFESFSNYLLNSLDRVKKRLGPARYGGIRKSIQQALQLQNQSGDFSKHYDWLRAILENYYDPMYEDQLRQRKDYIIFRGNFNECREYLQNS